MTPSPNLVSVAFLRESLRVWRCVPLTRRVCIRLRWRAWVLMPLLLALGLAPHGMLAYLYFTPAMLPVPLVSFVHIGITIVADFLLPFGFLLWYPRWSLRTFHRDDEELRLLPFTPNERFCALVLPGALIFMCYQFFVAELPGLFWNAAKLASWSGRLLGPVGPNSTLFGSVLQPLLKHTVLSVGNWFFFLLMARRILLFDSVTGRRNGRGIASLLLVGLALLLILLPCVVAYLLIAYLIGLTPLDPGAASRCCETLLLFMAVGSQLMVYRWFWKRDEPLAGECLFVDTLSDATLRAPDPRKAATP